MFKKTLSALYKYKFAVLLFILLGFLLGFFITEYIINNNFSYYKFEVNKIDNIKDYINEEYLEELELDIKAYNKDAKAYNLQVDNGEVEGEKLSTIYLPTGTSLKDIAKNTKIKENDDSITILIKRNTFNTTFVTKSMTLSKGITKCQKAMNSIFDSKVDGIENENIDIKSEFTTSGYINPYIAGLISSLTMLTISVAVFSIVASKSNENFLKDISDNELIFKTPFHKKYWTGSTTCFKKVNNLAVMAILFALMMCCKAISLPSGFGALGLSLTYLFFSIIACIYGPVAGLTIGLFSDILGFILFPDGQSFFLGYTIDAMLAGFTYGIFFYKTKITFAKCLYARLIVNLFINVILGSMWWSIINSFTFDAYVTYTLVISLPKNLIYLLPQAILLFLVLKAVSRPMASFNLVDERIAKNISIL